MQNEFFHENESQKLISIIYSYYLSKLGLIYEDLYNFAVWISFQFKSERFILLTVISHKSSETFIWYSK
ncbi:MAG: hypothetical protein H6Q14_1977 [Bacteroidetes bacterium]|jgi:hypothetical protein|nr:hypothetical protein [Bacteroidota bacterium]